MVELTSKNLLGFIKNYFVSNGSSQEQVSFLSAEKYSEALVLKLPAVCLVDKNKPENSKSKQSHIHVTGENRYFFFSENEIDNTQETTEDQIQKLELCENNINALNKKDFLASELKIIKSNTLKKIFCRAKQSSQVQISRMRDDDPNFIELRNGLYEGDLLVFLKQRNSNEMFALGIPKSFYEDKYKISESLLKNLESDGYISVVSALESAKEGYTEKDIVDSGEAISDVIYQEMVSAAEASTTSYIAEKYISAHPEGKSVKTTRPTTNPALGKEAIKDARYCCAVDKEHETFVKKNGEKYLEVHHLIPLERQNEFENKLDTKANLVSICPLCHKKIHYGRIEDIKPIIKKLFEEREEHLKTSGIEISFEKLLTYYE